MALISAVITGREGHAALGETEENTRKEEDETLGSDGKRAVSFTQLRPGYRSSAKNIPQNNRFDANGLQLMLIQSAAALLASSESVMRCSLFGGCWFCRAPRQPRRLMKGSRFSHLAAA